MPFVVTSSDHPQLFEPGNQVFLGPVALYPVAVPTEQLKVLEVVRPAGVDGNEVVHLQVSEVEGGPAASAAALLLTEEDMLVLAVRPESIDVRAAGNVGAGGDQAVVEQAPMDCWSRTLTSSTALGEMSMPTHCLPRFSAATQAVAQPQNGSNTTSPLVGRGPDDAFQEG